MFFATWKYQEKNSSEALLPNVSPKVRKLAVNLDAPSPHGFKEFKNKEEESIR